MRWLGGLDVEHEADDRLGTRERGNETTRTSEDRLYSVRLQTLAEAFSDTLETGPTRPCGLFCVFCIRTDERKGRSRNG